MHINTKARIMIQSLLRDLRVSDHIVSFQGGLSFSSSSVIKELAQAELDDTDFRAGWEALEDALGVQCEPFVITLDQAVAARKSA